MTKIYIKTEYIKLDSFLKHAAVCQTGGEAKIRILNEEFLVNKEVCKMRGKKLKDGDIICTEQNVCFLVCKI